MPYQGCGVSPASSFDSFIQESVDKCRKGKIGRGRPCKTPTAPMYDDFSEHGTAEEKKKWKMQKNVEEWQYKNLCLKMLSNTMKKESYEFLDSSQKNDRKLLEWHKGNLKCTSTSVIMKKLPKVKLKKRAE